MERKYLAVSIKHSWSYWKYGKPLTLWGSRRTGDDEERTFSGYTYYPKSAELYEAGAFLERGYPTDIIKEEPVTFTADICRRWRKDYDTVLVLEEEILKYYKNNWLALERPEDD